MREQKAYRILTVNPGSTSTKIAVFEDEKKFFTEEIHHSTAELAAFPDVNDQFDYRRDLINKAVRSAGIDIAQMDAYCGRGGSVASLDSGTYIVNDKMLEHTFNGLTGKHPSNLGARLAHEFARKYGGAAFIVDPPEVDEFITEARVTGFSEVWRHSHVHALNQKMICRRYAAQNGKTPADVNYVIAHLGGGVTITAHRRGRMIDSTDVMDGNGPMTPTRCGVINVKTMMDICFSGKYTCKELYKRLSQTGGLADHLGTSNLIEVCDRVEAGDEYAKLIYNSMIYQFSKYIGMMAAVLRGKVDAIILTGGMAKDPILVKKLTEMVEWIAPVAVLPGENEMEALADGALRALKGIDPAREYTGIPNWSPPQRTMSPV